MKSSDALSGSTAPVLSQTSAGAALSLVAVIAGVAMDVLAKTAAISAAPSQIALLRWSYCLPLLLPLLLVMRVTPGTPLRRIHLWRALLNLAATFCLYVGLAFLPLSVVAAVFYLEPLAAMILASCFLREHLGWWRWLGVAIALAGILAMTGVDELRLDPMILVPMAGAVAWGSMQVITRSAGRSDNVLALMFWLAIATSIGMAPVAAFQWQPLTLEDHLLMLGVAGLGTLYSLLALQTLKLAPVRVLAAISFLSLPVAFLAGFLFFGEQLTWQALGGGAAVLSGVALALRPARVHGSGQPGRVTTRDDLARRRG
jgi:drug/metabolite transporter (DMT)-like permease